RDGRVSLCPKTVWTDVRAFEHLVKHALGAASIDGEAADRALPLYRGSLFADEPEIAGAAEGGRTLMAKFARLVGRRAEQLDQHGNFAAAAALFERAVTAEPSIAAFHEGLRRYSAGTRESDPSR